MATWNAAAKAELAKQLGLDKVKYDPILKQLLAKWWMGCKEGQIPMPSGVPHPDGDLEPEILAHFVLSFEFATAEAVKAFHSSLYGLLNGFVQVGQVHQDAFLEVIPEEIKQAAAAFALPLKEVFQKGLNLENIPIRLHAHEKNLMLVFSVPEALFNYVQKNLDLILRATTRPQRHHADPAEGIERQPSDIVQTEAQDALIRRAFEQFDTDRSGTISRKELADLCVHMGRELNSTELEEAFNTLDRDESGTIEYHEFHEWWNSRDGKVSSRLEVVKRQLRLRYNNLKTIQSSLQSWSADAEIAVKYSFGDVTAAQGTKIQAVVIPDKSEQEKHSSQLSHKLPEQRVEYRFGQTVGAFLKALLEGRTSLLHALDNTELSLNVNIPVAALNLVISLATSIGQARIPRQVHQVLNTLALMKPGAEYEFAIGNLGDAAEQAIKALVQDTAKALIREGKGEALDDEAFDIFGEFLRNPLGFVDKEALEQVGFYTPVPDAVMATVFTGSLLDAVHSNLDHVQTLKENFAKITEILTGTVVQSVVNHVRDYVETRLNTYLHRVVGGEQLPGVFADFQLWKEFPTIPNIPDEVKEGMMGEIQRSLHGVDQFAVDLQMGLTQHPPLPPPIEAVFPKLKTEISHLVIEFVTKFPGLLLDLLLQFRSFNRLSCISAVALAEISVENHGMDVFLQDLGTVAGFVDWVIATTRQVVYRSEAVAAKKAKLQATLATLKVLPSTPAFMIASQFAKAEGYYQPVDLFGQPKK